MTTRYNHAYTIAFEVKTPHAASEVTPEELLRALQRRVTNLRHQLAQVRRGEAAGAGPEIEEACGLPYDTDDAQADTEPAAPAAPHCDMTDTCLAPITMIDRGGYAYCEAHGLERRTSEACRRLRPWELRRLLRGDTLTRY